MLIAGDTSFMLLNSLYIAAGLALLVSGAEALVRGSSGLALRLGVSALVVGMTIVAVGTSSPELVLSMEAARAGAGGIALGNIVGSNISNVALVLGAAALIRPLRVRSELIRRELPLMIAVTLLSWTMLLDGDVSRLDGAILCAGAGAYIIAAYVAARRGAARAVTKEFENEFGREARPVWLDCGLTIGGVACLVFGAALLLKGAVFVATAFGISQVVIGLSIVAVGTSLPELATTVAASRRGEADIAFGNVIGSNILNLLLVLGVAAVIHPFDTRALRTVDTAVMFGLAALTVPLMWRGWVLNRWEGATLLVCYAAYLYTLVP